MSQQATHAHGEETVGESPTVSRIAGIGTGLVAVNIALMLALSYTPVADLGLVLFSNYFVGIGTFVVTVGGGYWLANKGVKEDSTGLAVGGVSLTQFGYGLFGAALLTVAPVAWRLPAIGISAVVTGLITAAVTVVVYNTDHSFERWQTYSGALFVGGFAIGAGGVFVSPLLLVVASLCFFLGFVTDLTYEIWQVRAQEYHSTLLSAIGIYVAVMGVFVHVLQWVLRVMSVLSE